MSASLYPFTITSPSSYGQAFFSGQPAEVRWTLETAVTYSYIDIFLFPDSFTNDVLVAGTNVPVSINSTIVSLQGAIAGESYTIVLGDPNSNVVGFSSVSTLVQDYVCTCELTAHWLSSLKAYIACV